MPFLSHRVYVWTHETSIVWQSVSADSRMRSLGGRASVLTEQT